MNPEIDNALCRSSVYAALSLAFGPPDAEVVERLASREGGQHLRDALDALGLDLSVIAFEPPYPEADLPALSERNVQLFGHTAHGLVVPYETEYGKDIAFLQPQELADIGGFLAAFGLGLDAELHQRIDHVQCECELMAVLARKEAYALEADDVAMLEETRKAQRLFLRDHLGRFGLAFGTSLSRADSAGFYGAIGRVVARLVEYDCARVGITAGSEELGLRVVLDDGTSMACGGSDACAIEGCPT
ncbi:MAG: molecular chaperone TorD family protein [Myxococcota bacterium]